MGTVNRVTLLGVIDKEPENRATTTGNTMLTFGVRTSFKNRAGEWKSNWTNCVAFGKMAEYLLNCGLGPHDWIYVDGFIQSTSREYKGHKRYFTNVVINSAKVLQAVEPKERESPQDEDILDNEVSANAESDDDSDLPF